MLGSSCAGMAPKLRGVHRDPVVRARLARVLRPVRRRPASAEALRRQLWRVTPARGTAHFPVPDCEPYVVFQRPDVIAQLALTACSAGSSDLGTQPDRDGAVFPGAGSSEQARCQVRDIQVSWRGFVLDTELRSASAGTSARATRRARWGGVLVPRPRQNPLPTRGAARLGGELAAG